MWWNKKLHEKLNTLEDKIDIILANQDLLDEMKLYMEEIREAHISFKIMDKFECYMKNVDKLNSMINEIKGCASMCRASLKESKTIQDS
jgi:hypothetical protein